MFNNSLGTAVNNAISHVVDNFQANPTRFWNERDIHWSLFHYIKQEKVIKEAYPTQLIRAEFPTLKIFEGSRGHYDLVIINAESYSNPEIQKMKAQAPWQKYLELIKIDVAIEIKLWLNRLQPKAMMERADWDIQKLTDEAKNVKNAYFLNFVQLDFQREHNEVYYKQLREYLSTRKQSGLSILCVPSDRKIQPQKDNWL